MLVSVTNPSRHLLAIFNQPINFHFCFATVMFDLTGDGLGNDSLQETAIINAAVVGSSM